MMPSRSEGIAKPSSEVFARLLKLGVYWLAKNIDELIDKPWLAEVLSLEENEWAKRGLERRLQNARIGLFRPISEFDWSWPQKVDRQATGELLSMEFVQEGANAVLVGGCGVGETTIPKNNAYQIVVRGHTRKRYPPQVRALQSMTRTSASFFGFGYRQE